MNCDFDYCIYNRDYNCILDGIGINSVGMCDECTLVTISDEKLRLIKKEQLAKLEERREK